MDEFMIFSEHYLLTPSNPKWPRMIFYTHNFCRGGHAIAYV